MRIQPFFGNAPSAIRLARRLALSASALAIAMIIGAPRTFALDLDGVDGLNTETIASRDRLRVWDDIKQYGAETINERDRRYVKPDGIRSGNYLIFPEAGAAVVFDDNIYTRDFDKRSDWRSELTGGIKFQSDLPRHVLDFSLDGKIVNYAEYTDQDYANIRAKLDGALHFDSAHTISASILSAIEHEERDDPTYPLDTNGLLDTSLSSTAKGPIEVFHNRASVGITRDDGRL
ncbi:MAG TPA: outer membrane beta-barrel protein, partial [Hyphomicrobium sp.]|nr:outer membrane beta-barrel protein [Hyphomicrobium sp.]